MARRNDVLEAAYRARDGSAEHDAAWRDAADAFHRAVNALYEPFTGIGRRIRDGDRAAIDEALRFLEADPWCFRSGYLKEELMTALANTTLPDDLRGRVQGVVLHHLANREPRLLRPTGRLAANVWDEALAREVIQLGEDGTPEQREDAGALLRAVEHKYRSLAGGWRKAHEGGDTAKTAT